MTIPYYDNNGQTFYDRTVNLDLTHLYDWFLPHVLDGGHILDAGCGSGRDAKTFLERGYQVSAFDGSARMVALARQHTGLSVRHLTFAQMDYDSQFDAVWANASLLHVPREQLSAIIPKFIRALKPDGVWYMSFKSYPQDRHDDHGRVFTNFTVDSLRQLIMTFSELTVVDVWRNPDARPDHQGEYWINLIARRL